MDTTLAPLTVGGGFGDAFNHLSKNWHAWIGSALVYFGGMMGLAFVVIIPLVTVAVFGVAIFGATRGGPADDSTMLLVVAPLALFGLVFCLAMLYLMAISYLGTARLSLLALRGEPTTYWEIFHYARTPGPALGLFFLVTLIAFPLFCLGFIPGLVFRVAALFAPYLMVDRGLGPLEAIQGSIELFRSSWRTMLPFWFALAGLSLIMRTFPLLGAFAMMLVQSAAIGIAYLQLTGQTIGGLDDDGLPRRAPA